MKQERGFLSLTQLGQVVGEPLERVDRHGSAIIQIRLASLDPGTGKQVYMDHILTGRHALTALASDLTQGVTCLVIGKLESVPRREAEDAVYYRCFVGQGDGRFQVFNSIKERDDG
jgi:hypothetical protein